MRVDRRAFLAGMPASLLVACAARRTLRQPRVPALSSDDYVEHAQGAARFLRSQAVETRNGLAWRKSPDEPDTQRSDLYHGGAGPALFFLELYRATGDQVALDEALAGAAQVAATWPAEPNLWQIGLFGGLAGHITLFTAIASESRDPRLSSWNRTAVDVLERVAKPVAGGGVAYGANEVLYGNAGVILVLLELADEKARRLAIALGDGLLGRGETTAKGTRWVMEPGDRDELPNFSHGTAGVAFALARLYEATKDQRYLNAALSGARHILSLARTEGDVCLIPHALPGGAERYYLGYCHGPAGTARLFHQLQHVTGDPVWADWFRKSVNGVLYSGAPEARTPGFWDNVGQCCGSASLAELMLSLHRISGDVGYLELAHAIAADILRRGTRRSDGGYEWIHAENRADPFWRQSYTGYMQGAAGIGSLFLRLAAHDRKLRWKVRLPDNPLPM